MFDPDDLPMTPEQVEWVRAQRGTGVDPDNADGPCEDSRERSYSLAEIRNGTGWPRDARFVLLAPEPLHRHTVGGQSLEHRHSRGDVPHGYFGHPEDFPRPAGSLLIASDYELIDPASTDE
jgi:hypothetical protein